MYLTSLHILLMPPVSPYMPSMHPVFLWFPHVPMSSLSPVSPKCPVSSPCSTAPSSGCCPKMGGPAVHQRGYGAKMRDGGPYGT